MKTTGIKFALLAVLISALAAGAQPRYKERNSTDPGPDLKRQSIQGKIEKIEGQKAIVKTDDGKQVTVHLGPRDYWQKKGYRLQSGGRVTVDGWGELYGEDGGYLFAGGIYGDGFHFEFTDSHGYPRWADSDEWYAGWYPRMDFYQVWYWSPAYGGYAGWGPPPYWWVPPPRSYCPPPWWGHRPHPPHHRPHRPHRPPRGGWR